MPRPSPHITFRDRLLAEAVRSHELDGASPFDDAKANAAARRSGGTLEQRIVARARSLPVADQLRRAVHQFNAVIGWMIGLGVLLAVLAGAATARATLGVEGSGITNFFWVLGGVLVVQTIALLLWLVVFIVSLAASRRAAPGGPATSSISLGSLVVSAAQWLLRKVHPDAAHAAAVHGAARVHTTGAIGRWTFSSITHGLWLAFNIGCLVMVIVLLSARQYTFIWETTILTEKHYVRLTRAIAAVPEAAGFNAPTEQEIVASQRLDGQAAPTNSRESWSSLLVGSIVIYGFGPRLLLLGLSLSGRRAAQRRFRLDVTHLGYTRLEHSLADQPARLHEDGAENEQLFVPHSQPQANQRPLGPPAIVGVEISQPRSWPPPIPGVLWDDLGLLENRDDQQRVLEQLASGDTEPKHLVIVCDLTTTPDRGLARLISQLRQCLTSTPLLLLTGGHSLRSRAHDEQHVAQRVEDWRQLAAQTAITPPHVLELDLDHLTDKGILRLAEQIGVDSEGEGTDQRRLERAFEVIVKHVQQCIAGHVLPDDAAANAELHREIATIYRTDASSWRQLLAAPRSFDAKEIASSVQSSAQRVIKLLPDRLRARPAWMAAGALSGALGCVAAATLLSPVAIAALPTWSIIGAAIAAVVPRGNDSTAGPDHERYDYAQPVAAAALFAMLLELQGRDEATITRLLDAAVGDDDIAVQSDEDAKQLLDDLRHRLDLALAEVSS